MAIKYKIGDHVTVFVRNRGQGSYRSRNGVVVGIRPDLPEDWIDVQFDSDRGGEARGFYLSRYVSKEAWSVAY